MYSGWLLSANDSPADRVPDQPGGFVNVQFLHDPGPVGFRGLGADVQQSGRYLRRLAFCNQLQDLPLPGAERVGG